MCMVVGKKPILINHIRYSSIHTAIPPLKRKVIPACDINGTAVITLETVFCSYDDSDKIAQITAPDMDPFSRARWVVENPDADRLIGEMMMMEKREFFWCFLHGMMPTVSMEHQTFASCRHNHIQVTDGSYDFWPTIIPDANTASAQLK
ncbi:hypothetical protein N7493_006473 [Penicillium malachiteum]|uniref:Uncharacterized protein n=1 Tax=Penicillium malachiteum TaxID=1324776 RepID=A0AAD6HLH8_9EURO|nr:hypothetical protein N7493_006473 [Penicillium malachiteum]